MVFGSVCVCLCVTTCVSVLACFGQVREKIERMIDRYIKEVGGEFFIRKYV